MDFRAFGAVQAYRGKQEVELGGPKQRAVLALLLARPGQVVSADTLIDEIWGAEPPDAAGGTLQAYISRLRKALGPDTIEFRAPGYRLVADSGEIDISRFEGLAERGHDALADADYRTARDDLQDALQLWRGPPFAGAADTPALSLEAARLTELRARVREDLFAADIELGERHDLVAELEAAVAEEPLRERLRGHLMTALYLDGRQAEALRTFRDLEEMLRDELGLDPSPDLRRLEGRILRQDPSLEPGERALRGYRLIEQLGEGHSGVVYRARQPYLDRDVAIKVIKPRVANLPGFIRRFDAEAQVVARIEHPHVVPLYDYWRDPGGAYLTMRWMRRGSLRSAMQGRPLPIDEAATVTEQVAAALAAAHQSGVVHRDVKPDNVLLDEDGTAFLSDFGIARDLLESDDAEGVSGSSGYSSPEELLGGAATPASDVHALGLVVYEMITGSHPFAGSPPGVLSRRLIEEAVPPPSAAVPGLPQRVDEVVGKATAKEPAERYQGPLQLARELNAAIGRAGTSLLAADGPALRNPYRGLRPFHEADAGDFFGRTAYVERLLGRLGTEDGAGRFAAVVGPSGSGKSSVLRAGLVPALRRGAVPGSERWLISHMVPDVDPFAQLAEAVLENATESVDDLVASLRDGRSGLKDVLDSLLPADTVLLLVVDQLEELYTVAGSDQAARFLDALVDGLEAEPRLRLAVGVRADFYDRPLAHSRFGPLLAQGTVPLPPLSADEISDAVLRPAARVGIDIEPALVAEVLKDASGRSGSLPLLQHALSELFENRGDHTLSREGYRVIGGIAGALAGRAEDVFAGFDPSDRVLVRRLFLQLVTPGEGVGDTRRRVLVGELFDSVAGLQSSLLEPLVAARLIAFDRDPATRAPTAEISHEALLGAWSRLGGWIDDARDELRMARGLRRQARDWEAAMRDNSFLLRGSRLAQIEAWADSTEMSLPGTSADYLVASREARDAELAAAAEARRRERDLERRARRRRRALISVVSLAVVVAGGLTALVLGQRSRADREADVAAAIELATAARANLDSDPELAVLLAVEAVETTRGPHGTVERDALEVLHSAVLSSRTLLTVPGNFAAEWSPDGSLLASSADDGIITIYEVQSGAVVTTLAGHRERVIWVEFTPDGRGLVSVSEDGTARVWDLDSGETTVTFTGHEGAIFSSDLSPDGSFVVSRGPFEGMLRFWSVASGEELNSIPFDGFGLHLSPDGKRLVAARDEGPVIFGVPGGEILHEFPGLAHDVRFSPDGRFLAVAGGDRLVSEVWDVETAQIVAVLSGHTGAVETVDYSPDGSLIATGSLDGTARLWDAASGGLLLTLPGLSGGIEHLTFAPDGRRLAAASTSGFTKVWALAPEASAEVTTFAGDPSFLVIVGYSPDGGALATVSFESDAVIRSLPDGDELLRIEGPIADVRWGGGLLATAYFDGSVRLWDGATGAPAGPVLAHNGFVVAATPSPDGRFVATTEGRTTRIWDVATGDLVHELLDHEGDVLYVAFNRDGTLVATGSRDETITVWSTESGVLQATLIGHTNTVSAFDFGPDGSTLVSTAADGAVIVWDVTTAEIVHRLAGHAAAAWGAAYSPSGDRLATVGDDRLLRIWEPATGRELLTIGPLPAAATSVTFHPDGRHVAVATIDGVIRVITLDVDELLAVAASKVTRELTAAECRQYLGGDCRV